MFKEDSSKKETGGGGMTARQPKKKKKKKNVYNAMTEYYRKMYTISMLLSGI
jgi:hypothetical protein